MSRRVWNHSQSGFPKESMMRRFLLTILLILVVSPAWALTTYYVDPDFAGTPTGAAATPWTSLTSSAWTTINTTLATDAVTVYFSARNAGSDTNQASTVAIALNRTDTSTHVLTLDGISKYNTNDTTPSWASYITPSPSNYQAASKFQITSNTPMQSSGLAAFNNCLNYITIQGFRFIATEGQVANLTYVGNLIFQFNDGSRNAGGTYGPGVYVGPGNNGPGCGGNGPVNVSVLYNYIHHTWGECIYIGASTPDPSTPTGGAQATGDNYLIQGNQIESCAAVGGQGDGIDVKDGHTNLRIINNVLRPTLNVGPNDGQGMAIESGTLIDGNYIEAPGHNCLAVFDGWHNSTGRSGLTIRNNICVNVNSGVGHNNGIELFDIPSSAVWVFVKVLNNTIHNINSGNQCVVVQVGHTATVQNNIFSTCPGGGLSASSGTLSTHDYNHYFGTGSSSISYSGTFACASVTSSEAHSLCSDPIFVSTSTPYVATNFEVRAGSLSIGTGLDLSGTFTSDYAGLTRAVPWDRGAFKALTSAPLPPTGLVVR